MIICKCLAEVGAKSAKGTDFSNGFDPHHKSQSPLGQSGENISPQRVGEFPRKTVNYVIPFLKFRNQDGDFFWRMLQIIIHGDNDLVLCRAYAA